MITFTLHLSLIEVKLVIIIIRIRVPLCTTHSGWFSSTKTCFSPQREIKRFAKKSENKIREKEREAYSFLDRAWNGYGC